MSTWSRNSRRIVPISRSTNGWDTGTYGIDLISSTSNMRKLASQRWKRNSGSWSELRCRGSDFPAMIWLNIRQTDTPQRSARSTPKPMIRRVNTSITTMTQWLRSVIDSQRNRSTLHRLSFICPDKAQPGRAIGSCRGPIVFREHPADDVFVVIDAKGVRNLLCDAGTAKARVAAFDLDDRIDKFLRWSL